MSISTLIRRMSDAGAPPEAIALAVEEIEAVQSSLDARRAADRDRKRVQREAQKSADVTGHSEDSPETGADKNLSPLAPPKASPTPPTNTPLLSPKPCSSERAKHWHRLPDDWVPRRLPEPVQAKVDQWPPGALGDELASFRRWAANAENKNGRGRKLDWDQAWRNWIGRRHDDHYSRHTGQRGQLGKSAAAFAMLNPSNDLPF